MSCTVSAGETSGMAERSNASSGSPASSARRHRTVVQPAFGTGTNSTRCSGRTTVRWITWRANGGSIGASLAAGSGGVVKIAWPRRAGGRILGYRAARRDPLARPRRRLRPQRHQPVQRHPPAARLPRAAARGPRRRDQSARLRRVAVGGRLPHAAAAERPRPGLRRPARGVGADRRGRARRRRPRRAAALARGPVRRRARADRQGPAAVVVSCRSGAAARRSSASPRAS